MKVAQSYLTLCDPTDYSPWNSPGQNTGVGGLSLLQGIFPTQGWNPGLPHCADSLPAEPQGKPLRESSGRWGGGGAVLWQPEGCPSGLPEWAEPTLRKVYFSWSFIYVRNVCISPLMSLLP